MTENRGTQWERILRKSLPHVDPRWTLTGRGARAVLTWGRVGWVWQHIALDLKSGSLHELYASRTWTDVPLSPTIDALARDLVPESSPDRLFELDDPEASAQVRRWAALVPDQVFALDLEQHLERFEWQFQLFLDESSRLPWKPLAGLRVQFGLDARPVVDAAERQLLTISSVRRREQDHPGLLFWREFRSRLGDGRDGTLAWLDEHRRSALREERVPDYLVDPVVASTRASG